MNRHSVTEPDQGVPMLHGQLAWILRHRWLVVLGLGLGLVGGLAASALLGSAYTATSDVLVQTTSASPFSESDATRQISIQTEIEIAESQKVAEIVIDETGADADVEDLQRGLRVTNPPETAILRFNYSDESADLAAERANAFAAAYLADRQARTSGVVTRLEDALEAEIAELTSQRDALDAEIAEADEATRGSLEVRRGSLLDEISAVNQRLVEARTLDTTPGDVVRTATPPDQPDGPGLFTWLLVGAVLGTALGLVLAWVASLFDRRVHTRADVAGRLGAPVLVSVASRRLSSTAPLLDATAASGPSREAYRGLALSLTYGDELAAVRTLLVLEPRTTGAAAAATVELSAELAEIGRRVALVEADLRNPSLRSRLPLRLGAQVAPGGGGDSNGEERTGWPTEELQVDVTGTLTLVPGTAVPRVAETLASPEASEFLADLKERHDIVVVLAPALLSEVDGLALAHRVDGVLVVCDAKRVRNPDLEAVRDMVRGAGGVVVGAVLVDH